MLLPALIRARQQAEAVACLNHLKQLTLAWHLYAIDQSDWLSPAETRADTPGFPRWVDGMITPPIGRIQDATNSALLLAPGPGHLGPYVKKAEVFHCPGDDSRTNHLKRVGPRRVRSYTMNGFIGFGGGGTGGNLETGLVFDPDAFVRMGDFRAKALADIFLLIDTHEQTITHGMFLLQPPYAPPDYSWITAWPAGRHGRRCPLSFADGHGEIRKWLDSRTAPDARRAGQSTVHSHNPDYQWLWDRAWDPGLRQSR